MTSGAKYCPICLIEVSEYEATCPEHKVDPGKVRYGKQLGEKVFDERFDLLNQIGAGGTGVIYRATDRFMSGEEVALKVLQPHFAKMKSLVKRFVTEIQAARQLRGRHFVRIRDYGRAKNGVIFYSMEMLRGLTLDRVCKLTGPMETGRAVHVAIDVCTALAEAHALGIVHRDLKPQNIMLVRSGETVTTKVLDFGVVKFILDDRPGVTAAGVVCGTPEYLSPEQAAGGKVDARTDLYSLGVLLYEMLSAVKPFGSASDAATQMAVVLRHAKEPAPPIQQANPEVQIPDPLAELVHRLLMKRPDERPPSAAETRRLLSLNL